MDCEDELPSILPDPEMGVFYIPENLNNLGSVDKSIGNYKNLDKQVRDQSYNYVLCLYANRENVRCYFS